MMDGDDELKAPEKSSAWSDDDRERRAPPPAPVDTVVPDWAPSFRVGEVIPLRGWNCRIVGHCLDDAGAPMGFVLVPESLTAAELKRRKHETKRRSLRIVQ